MKKADYSMMTARDIISYMESLRNERQREVLMRFFKTGVGEYGYGDEFLGIKVPQTREVVKLAKDLPLSEVPVLIRSKWHEVRLCGLLILVAQFERFAGKRLVYDDEAMKRRNEIVRLYVSLADYINNWDLVDLSAPKILGHWLMLPAAAAEALSKTSEKHDVAAPFHDIAAQPSLLPTHKLEVVDKLAHSEVLWHKRISMVCTLKPMQMGDAAWCLRYAEMHCRHPHDLMQKAVGWMLRELGKHVSMDLLRSFLEVHAATLPRTALRYAIEHMSPAERMMWMGMKK